MAIDRRGSELECPLPGAWASALRNVESRLSAAVCANRAGRGRRRDAVPAAAARAHARLLQALQPSVRVDIAPDLHDAAAVLLLAVAYARTSPERPQEDRRAHMLRLLRRSLGAHETRALAGEVTYALHAEEGQEAAERVRVAATHLAKAPKRFLGDLLSLELASADLAALLVRAAANTAAGGRADQAPEQGSVQLERGLQAIVLDLAVRANAVDRPADVRGDVVAHHLAAGLRVHARQDVPDLLADPPSRGQVDLVLLNSASQAWLRIATHIYVALTALNARLDAPAYDERFPTLDAAIVEGASNVVCGARLLSRPEHFRHQVAWRHQAVGLSYAVEAYVAGLGGLPGSFEQALLIGLTRLIRAVTAIQLLRLCHTRPTPTNRRGNRHH